MADTRSKGTLSRWFDDKGFGFITSEKERSDVFIHISAFGSRLPRKPQVGDTIFYFLKKDEEGKLAAYDAIIAGSTSEESQDYPIRKNSYSNHSTNNFGRLIGLLIILTIVVWAMVYKRHFTGGSSLIPKFSSKATTTSSRYSCQGKTYCSEMTSCEEATFYIENCPGTKMDGDGDGIPCESQWCN